MRLELHRPLQLFEVPNPIIRPNHRMHWRTIHSLLRGLYARQIRGFHHSYRHQKHDNVRVRFAPSPTGYLHLGGLRTALYNYLFAKSKNGTFILRVEDTDQNRLVPGSLDHLLEMLHLVGLSPDEGPYKQSERQDIYHEDMKTLLEKGSCYKCFCTPQRLDLLRKNALRNKQTPRYDNRCRSLTETQIKENLEKGLPFVVRFKMEPNSDPYEDLILGKTAYDVGSIEGDPVMIKADGFPTYHFANVVDDHQMEITHVLRGQEWLMSTHKHLLLYKAFGWSPPKYAHLPLVLNKDGRTKLSKRFGNNTLVSHFKDIGIYPDAVLNFLTFCGGGFEENQQIMTLSEMIDKFSLERVANHSAILDLNLLPGVNQAHLIRRFDNKQDQEEIVKELQDEVGKVFKVESLSESFLVRILELRKNHINSIRDLTTPENSYLWVRPSLQPEDLNAVTSDSASVISRVSAYFDREINGDGSIDDLKRDLKKLHQDVWDVKWATLMKLLRICLSGKLEGPGVADMMTMLGHEEVCQRLKVAQAVLTDR